MEKDAVSEESISRSGMGHISNEGASSTGIEGRGPMLNVRPRDAIDG